MFVPARRVLVLVPFVGLFAVALSRAPQQAVSITTHAVAGSVHMLEATGGNVGVSIGPDGVLMIDDQFEQQLDGLLEACNAIGPGALRFVVNTHWHGDHTGGNARLSGDVTILANANVLARMSTDQQTAFGPRPASPKTAWPVVTYDQGLSLHMNGEEVRVTHYPNGHTDGDSVVYFTGSNVVHMGDLFFNGMFPFIDYASGGSILGVTRAVGTVLEWLPSDAKVIPGHGPLASKEDLRAYYTMLIDSLARVRTAIDAGQTLAEMKSDKLLEKYESLTWGFVTTDMFLDTLHQELSSD